MDSIASVEQLEDLLSEPTAGVIDTLGRVKGDLILLGVGGKMGPTLARMAKRASDAAGVRRRIIGVSRFSRPGLENRLHDQGIETFSCDLLDPDQLEQLPGVPNVIYMAGRKFGSTENEHLTWAMNSFLPGLVCQKYCRSRIVVFSTGNVYGLTPVSNGGSRETDTPNPAGEYAMSCLGRERIFEHFSRTLNIPLAIVRLNYAVETRYGVLVDIARQVQMGQPIDLTMGYCNVVWQGDANAMALQALAQTASPPQLLNIAGPEVLSVRQVAEEFGQLFGKPVSFRGVEAPDALLSNGQRAIQLFGSPRINASQMIRWIAAWTERGGEYLDKPTHFEVRDGKF
jgi:nucleoside-diphosphate-sugar epimerase